MLFFIQFFAYQKLSKTYHFYIKTRRYRYLNWIIQGGGFRDSLSKIAEELYPPNAVDATGNKPLPLQFFIHSPNQVCTVCTIGYIWQVLKILEPFVFVLGRRLG